MLSWKLLLLLSFIAWLPACTQLRYYTTANAHSHNDYEQQQPFEEANRAGFGSVEADVFLRGGTLFVAHEAPHIAPGRTLGALYLEPLSALPADRNMQLLIDLKTGADSTLPALVEELGTYPALREPSGIKIVISGNRPAPEKWPESPAFIFFDGRPGEDYKPATLQKVGLISDNFRNYSQWNGTGTITERERRELRRVVRSAHAAGKPFRFWAVPDTPAAWRLMTRLGVDYINTDRIEALAAWLKNRNSEE